MILGQSAATAACIAIDDDVSVQDMDYGKLRKQLIADKPTNSDYRICLSSRTLGLNRSAKCHGQSGLSPFV